MEHFVRPTKNIPRHFSHCIPQVPSLWERAIPHCLSHQRILNDLINQGIQTHHLFVHRFNAWVETSSWKALSIEASLKFISAITFSGCFLFKLKAVKICLIMLSIKELPERYKEESCLDSRNSHLHWPIAYSLEDCVCVPLSWNKYEKHETWTFINSACD